MNNQVTWFKQPQPNPEAEMVLVCFPHAGGGASAYREWPNALPDNVEVIAAELPGRESRLRESPLQSLDEVIAALKSALPPLLDGRPYALFGHSLGALLAFETTRALRRDNHSLPLCLFSSGREAPTEREPGRHLHNLPDDEFVEEMISRYDGIPQILLDEPELLELFMPAMKADLRLTEMYAHKHEEPFEFPLHILSGKNDTRLTHDLLTPWADQTIGSAHLNYFDGGHFFVRDSYAEVTDYVSRTLQGVMAEETAQRQPKQLVV